MPYKPTGRPNGRPRKEQIAGLGNLEGETVDVLEETPTEPKRKGAPPRARAQFRKMAEEQNPSPFVVMRDARGRARHAPRHSSVKV